MNAGGLLDGRASGSPFCGGRAGASDRRALAWPLVAGGLALATAVAVGQLADRSGAATIALLLAFAGVVAIAVRPDNATLVFTAILYSNAAAIMVQFHDLPYFAGAAFPFILVVPLVYHVVIRRRMIVLTRVVPLLFVFTCVIVVGELFGSQVDPPRAMDAFITYLVEGVLIFLVLTNVVRSFAIVRRMIWVLLFVGGAIGGMSTIQQVTNDYSNTFFGFAQVSAAALTTDSGDLGPDTQPRLAGMIGEKNRYGQVMLVLVPLGLFRIWDERDRRLKLLAGGLTTLIALGTILSFSRGAALGFALTIALMAIFRYIRPTQLAAIGLATLVLLTFQPVYAERLLSIASVTTATAVAGESSADTSFRKRANETLAALLVFADHPFIGVGRGLFPDYYGQYADEVAIEVEYDNRQAHDLYAGLAAETGIIGLAAFVGMLLVTLGDLARARRRWLGRRAEWADTATALMLSIVSYMTTGIFLHIAYERYFWFLLAFASVTAWLLNRPDIEQEEAAAVEDPRAVRAMPAGTAAMPA